MQMERVHYRRYTPSRLQGQQRSHRILDDNLSNVRPVKRSGAEKIGFREKLIVQGIISGIILAVVLVLSMIQGSQVMVIQTNLNKAISEHITAQQVAREVNRFLGNGRQSAFINELILTTYVEEPFYNEPFLEESAYIEQFSAFEAETPVEGQITTPRIDEDILREIFGWSEGDDLQTTAPEPMTLPEL